MKKKIKKWTKEEEDFLIKNYADKGSKYVAKELGRCYKSIQQKIYRIGATKLTLNKWNQYEIEIIKANCNLSVDELHILLPNKTINGIRTKKNRLGLSTKKPYKWDEKDKQFLIEHWPMSDAETIKKLFPTVKRRALTEMARRLGVNRLVEYRKGDLSPLLKETNVAYYWMGFIMADGWISKEGQLVVGLSKSDINHLDKLAKLLKTEIKIIHTTEKIFFGKKYICDKSARIAVQDKKLGLELKNKMNISIRKTYNAPNLSFLDTENKFISFLAGFIDGDGSFSNQKTVALKIQCHINWLDNFKYIKDRIDKIIPNNIRVFADEKGYASLSTTNQTFLSKLKIMVVELNIPIMKRKWDRIDINHISKKDKNIEIHERVINLIKSGKNIKEIAYDIGYAYKSMHEYMRRNNIEYKK